MLVLCLIEFSSEEIASVVCCLLLFESSKHKHQNPNIHDRPGAPNGIFRSNICSDGRLPKNFEIFFPVDTLDLSNFSENHKDSLEFSELMYSLLSCSIIFGRFSLFPKNLHFGQVDSFSVNVIFKPRARGYHHLNTLRCQCCQCQVHFRHSS